MPGDIQKIISNYKRVRRFFDAPPAAIVDVGIDLRRERSKPCYGRVIEYQPPPIRLQTTQRKIRLAEILLAVADYYRVPPHEIRGKHREAPIVRARHAFVHLALKHTAHSLAEIGREISKDHTTIIHAKTKMARRAHADTTLQRELTAIERKFLDENTVA